MPSALATQLGGVHAMTAFGLSVLGPDSELSTACCFYRQHHFGCSEQAEKTIMNIVTIGVASLGDTQRRLSAALRGKKQGARVSFASEDLL
jgi:hypothetical protein